MRKYSAIPTELFALNRKRFTEKMKPNSVAIFHAADLLTRNGDCFFPFRQNSDIFYLSGLDQEETVLLLYPDCPKGKEYEAVIFTKQTNDYIKVWEGYKYTKEDASKISGIPTVVWLDSMPALLNEMILLADNVYINANENDRASGQVAIRDERLALELKAKYPAHNFVRSAPIMKKLRMIKSHFEIEIMQKACDITEKAFRSVLANTKPGMMEYEVEADIIYEFIRNDAADLSRTIPVNGRFNSRQRAVYDAVLRVKTTAEKMLVPGNKLMDYHKEVGKVMEGELLGLGLITKDDIAHQKADWPAYKKYFMHGTSHHLGLDVHDLCERYSAFEVGMVFTCEPGIYIPEEGIGIRIEDDILITEKGTLNLMRNIPIEADEIEELMNK
jgi:Xaa-Pro aminopeptidase